MSDFIKCVIANNNKLEKIKKFVKKNKLTKDYIIAENDKGNTLLMDICCCGSVKSIQYLLQEEFKVTKENILKQNKNYVNALMYASKQAYIDVIKYIVETFNITKEDILEQNENGDTVLMYACEHNNFSNTKYFMDTFDITKEDIFKKNKDGNTVIMNIVRNYDGKSIAHVIEKHGITKEDILKEGFDILTFVCKNMVCLSSLELIIEKFNMTKEDILKQDEDGNSPFIFVCDGNFHRRLSYPICGRDFPRQYALQYLIKRFNLTKEEINRKNNNGYTAITLNNNPEIQKILSA